MQHRVLASGEPGSVSSLKTPDHFSSLWIVGAICFAFSGGGFLVGVVLLYLAEGPGSPDLLSTLVQPSGQQLFSSMVAAFSCAIVLWVIGVVTLFTSLKESHWYALLVVVALNIMTSAAFLSFLELHYALVVLGKEGRSATDPGYQEFAIVAHAAADLGGWISIAIFAFSILVISLVFCQHVRWKGVGLVGFFFVALAVLFFFLDVSYLFLIPFGLWELIVAATFLSTRERCSFHQQQTERGDETRLPRL